MSRRVFDFQRYQRHQDEVESIYVLTLHIKRFLVLFTYGIVEIKGREYKQTNDKQEKYFQGGNSKTKRIDIFLVSAGDDQSRALHNLVSPEIPVR